MLHRCDASSSVPLGIVPPASILPNNLLRVRGWVPEDEGDVAMDILRLGQVPRARSDTRLETADGQSLGGRCDQHHLPSLRNDDEADHT